MDSLPPSVDPVRLPTPSDAYDWSAEEIKARFLDTEAAHSGNESSSGESFSGSSEGSSLDGFIVPDHDSAVESETTVEPPPRRRGGARISTGGGFGRLRRLQQTRIPSTTEEISEFEAEFPPEGPGAAAPVETEVIDLVSSEAEDIVAAAPAAEPPVVPPVVEAVVGGKRRRQYEAVCVPGGPGMLFKRQTYVEVAESDDERDIEV